MKILGNRVLVSKVEEEKKEGQFQTVDVQDSFVYKGKVEDMADIYSTGLIKIGDVVLFAKYSPDTQEVKHDGKDMKIIRVEDILAIL